MKRPVGSRRTRHQAEGRTNGPAESRSGPPSRSLWWVPFALAVIAYLPTLGHGFVWDDVNFIAANPAAHEIRSVGATLSRGYGWTPAGTERHDSSLYYRPLIGFVNTLSWAVFDGRPGLFHLCNALVHAANAALLTVLAFWLGLSAVTALCVGVLFAIHPALSEPVAWISGRTDLLATFFTLSALLLLVAWRTGRLPSWPRKAVLAAAAAATFLALASKESAIVLLALAPIALKVGSARSNSAHSARRAWVALGLTAGMYLLLRVIVLREGAWSGAAALHERGSFPARLLLAGNLFLTYLRTLLVPWPLAIEPPAALARGHGAWVTGVLGAGLALCAGVLWVRASLRARSSPARLLGVGLLLVGLLPVLQLVPIGEIYGERFLYLPVAGLLLVAASFAEPWLRRTPRRAWWVLGALGIPYLVLLQVRLPDWKDELTLYSSAVRARPASARALASLGSVQMDRGLLREAERSLAEAVRLDPEDPWKRSQYGALLINTGRPAEGTRLLEQVWAGGERSPALRLNLGIGLTAVGRYAEAEPILRGALSADPTNAAALDALAMAERKRGALQEAAALLRRAVASDPARRGAWLNLIGVLGEEGQWDAARDVGRQFLARFPDSPEASAVRELVAGGS